MLAQRVPRVARRTGLWCVLATSLLVGGCVGEGSVEVRLQLPEEDELSPTQLTISEITLITSMPDRPTRSETHQVFDPSAGVDLGRVEVGEDVELTLSMSSPSQRLVGFGRSSPIEVTAEGDVAVPINLRRPFVYMTGGLSITAFDSTQDQASADYQSAIGVPGNPIIVVPTPDGADLAVVAVGGNGASLVLVSTSTHVRRDEVAGVPLGPFPTDAAVSPDNRFLVVAHEENPGGQGGLSIIDLEAARAGASRIQFVPLAGVGAVSVANGRAFALIDRSTVVGCQATASSIVAVDLESGASGPTVSFTHGIHDMAVASDGQTVVVADSCDNALVSFNIDDDATRTPLATLTGASSVAIANERVWGVGTLPPEILFGARLELLSIPIDGNMDEMTRVALAPTEERAESDMFNEQGQSAQQVLDADELIAYEIAVVPGAGHIALLTRAKFVGVESGNLGGFPIIPSMEMEAWEYLLVNAATTSIVQRQRTRCTVEWDSTSLPWLDQWDCGALAGQDIVPKPGYAPLRISVLYGTR